MSPHRFFHIFQILKFLFSVIFLFLNFGKVQNDISLFLFLCNSIFTWAIQFNGLVFVVAGLVALTSAKWLHLRAFSPGKTGARLKLINKSINK